MSAKEMFEAMGYRQTRCLNEHDPEYAKIEYEYVIEREVKIQISFMSGCVYTNLYHYSTDENKYICVGGCSIDSDLLQAIIQQMKELKWTDM